MECKFCTSELSQGGFEVTTISHKNPKTKVVEIINAHKDCYEFDERRKTKIIAGPEWRKMRANARKSTYDN